MTAEAGLGRPSGDVGEWQREQPCSACRSASPAVQARFWIAARWRRV